MNGFLNINKASGPTSREIVNRIQRKVRPAKVGHSGTLDPLASGVLVVAVGHATRLIEYVQRAQKCYIGTFQFGIFSDTEDITGSLQQLEEPQIPTESELRNVLPRFLGKIQQTPPAYSALKVKGKRAYDLARAGKEVSLKPRSIEVYDLQIVEFDYPTLVLRISCGSGTYIRSLGRDISANLDTVAVMTDLVRTRVGDFTISDAQPIDTAAENVPALLQPMSKAVSELPCIRLTDAEVKSISFGQHIPRADLRDVSEAAAFNALGELVAILARRPGGFGPTKNFCASN